MVRVLVIGAGFAGLAAANDLIAGGVDDVLVVDAREKPGGRVCTLRDVVDNNDKIEMGATFIHGSEHNPVFTIANENELLKLDQPSLRSKIQSITEDGVELSTRLSGETDFFYGNLMMQCEDFFQMQTPVEIENESLGEFMMRKFEDEMEQTGQTGEGYVNRRALFRQRLKLDSFMHGTSVDNVSLDLMGEYTELPGIHYNVPKGFESIVRVCRSRLPDSKLRLKTIVRKIRWQHSAPSSASDKQSHRVKVECDDGEELEADHVICTCSLGYLKANSSTFFDPPLPDIKLDAISALQFGKAEKLFLEFDQSILPDDVSRIELVWTDEAEEGPDKPWYQSLFTFDALGDRILQTFVFGDAAATMEGLSDETIGSDCQKVLSMFLKKSVPEPKRVLHSTWCKHPQILGAYTFVPTGCPVGCQAEIGRPLPHDDKPTLCFAGEHTSSEFYSTTHGALLTGRREAKRLLDHFGLSSSRPKTT